MESIQENQMENGYQQENVSIQLASDTECWNAQKA